MKFGCNRALTILWLLSYPLGNRVTLYELSIILLHLLHHWIYWWGPLPTRLAFLHRRLLTQRLHVFDVVFVSSAGVISCHIRILAHGTHELSLFLFLLNTIMLILAFSCWEILEKKHVCLNNGPLEHVWFIIHCLLERLAALVTKWLLARLELLLLLLYVLLLVRGACINDLRRWRFLITVEVSVQRPWFLH